MSSSRTEYFKALTRPVAAFNSTVKTVQNVVLVTFVIALIVFVSIMVPIVHRTYNRANQIVVDVTAQGKKIQEISDAVETTATQVQSTATQVSDIKTKVDTL